MLIRRRSSILTDASLNILPLGDSTGPSGNKRKKIDEVIVDGPHKSKKARREPTLLDAVFDLPTELSQEVPNLILLAMRYPLYLTSQFHRYSAIWSHSISYAYPVPRNSCGNSSSTGLLVYQFGNDLCPILCPPCRNVPPT